MQQIGLTNFFLFKKPYSYLQKQWIFSNSFGDSDTECSVCTKGIYTGVSYKSCADKQTKWERTEARKAKVL